MARACNNCGTENANVAVPYVAHESAMARAERHTKALIWVIVLLIVLLVGSNIAWIAYENSFEEVATEDYQMEQDAESGNNNSIINGGEIVNGEAND